MKYWLQSMTIMTLITSLVFLQTTVTASEVTPEAAYLIRSYKTSIKLANNDTFVIEGRTETYTVVDSVSVTIYLQVWYDSQWHDVRSWTSSRENDDLAYLKVNIGGMPRGYFYRTRGVHCAMLNNYSETLNSYSGTIYY
jgi:hypothetical protein